MTTVIYEPEGPAVEFIGHAGAGLYGSDPVCAALSILMYTLIAAAPGAQVYSRPGYCRVDGGPIKAQRSGFDGERRRSGESELSQPCGSEGFEACADAGYCRVDGGNSPRRCGAPPPPSLSAARTSLPAGESLPSLRGAGERASPEAAFAVVKKGLGLLAEHFPRNVRLVVKHRAGWKGEKLAAAAGGGCRQTAFSAAAPLAGRGAEARPGNGKCGKALAWSFPVSYGKRGSETECVSFDEKE